MIWNFFIYWELFYDPEYSVSLFKLEKIMFSGLGLGILCLPGQFD